jgi:hypothetical protein
MKVERSGGATILWWRAPSATFRRTVQECLPDAYR